jgi:hypothetical protein
MRALIVALVLLVASAAFAQECFSDYDCDYGSKCVKDQFATEGTCAQKVNRYDVPVYTPPDPNSVMPGGKGDCQFDTQCPIGFECVKGDGQLYGHCMKQQE